MIRMIQPLVRLLAAFDS